MVHFPASPAGGDSEGGEMESCSVIGVSRKVGRVSGKWRSEWSCDTAGVWKRLCSARVCLLGLFPREGGEAVGCESTWMFKKVCRSAELRTQSNAALVSMETLQCGGIAFQT